MPTNFPNTSGINPDTSAPWADGDAFDDTTESGLIYYWYDPVWNTEFRPTAASDARYVEVVGDTMTGDLTVPRLNGGPLAGFRNHIINGDFRIAQRGTSITIPGGDPASYTLDRWVGSAGDTVSQNYTSDTLCLQTTGTWVAGSVEIDVFNNSAVPAEFSPGTQWTLSYYADKPPGNSLSTLITFRERVVNAVSTVDVSDNVDVPTATGESIGSLIQYSTTFTINNFTLADTRCLSFHLEGNSAGVNFAYAQLEPGPVATPFEHRPYATELALCQRYYYQVNANGFLIYPSSNNLAAGQVQLPVEMRVAPSFTFDGASTVSQWGVINRTGNLTGGDVISTPNNVGINFTIDPAVFELVNYYAIWNGGNGTIPTYFKMSAEL